MKWVASAGLLILAGLFGLLALGHTLLVDEMREVWARGKVAEGTLVAQHRHKKGTGREYTYTFQADGATITAERRAIPYAAGSLPVGSKLAVRYDPADPSRSVTSAELQELEHPANRAFLPIVAIALLAGAIYVASRVGRNAPPT